MRNGLIFVRCDSGQSIVETVLMLPLLLLLLLNALNFGYFFFTVVNLTGATRNGLEYGIIGSATPAASAQPQDRGRPLSHAPITGRCIA